MRHKGLFVPRGEQNLSFVEDVKVASFIDGKPNKGETAIQRNCMVR